MTNAQRETIDQLYFSLYKFLVSYANSSLKNHALAEEAVQETFAIACTKPAELCDSTNPKGWLVNTLRNVISNMERRKAAAEKLVADCLGDRMDLIPAGDIPENLELLYCDIARTKEFQLMLEISQGQRSLIEIAEEEGITVGACKKRAQRAREFLQKYINSMSPF